MARSRSGVAAAGLPLQYAVMDLDSEICHCYHVSLRKLVRFARRTRPTHAAGMTQCLGAGTGCGGCVAKLRLIAEMAERSDEEIIHAIAERWPYG